MGQPKGTELYTVGQPHYAGWLCVGQPKGTGASLEQDIKLPACSPATPHCARLRRLLAWNARSPATPARLERLLACNAALRTCMLGVSGPTFPGWWSRAQPLACNACSPGTPGRLQRRTALARTACSPATPHCALACLGSPTLQPGRLGRLGLGSPTLQPGRLQKKSFD